MKLNINFRNTAGRGEVINHIDKRLSFAFSRTRHAIASTSVTITDVNGPKGGVDMMCQIIVQPIGLKRIVIADRRENVRQAIDRCIARASQSLDRKLKRRLALRHKGTTEKWNLAESSPAT